MERARMGREPRGDVQGVFVFALLAVFALLSLAVVLVGARAYRTVNQTADATNISRTGMSYLVGKVRGADAEGAVNILQKDGMDVLALGATYGEKPYVTYIYCDGSSIREYFSAADVAFDAAFGEEILTAKSLAFSLDDRLLTITMVDEDGGEHVSKVSLVCGEGAAQ